MSPPSDSELADESKVAQARMEGLLEDENTTRDITLEELSNTEVLMLTSALSNAEEMFLSQGAKPPAALMHELNRRIQQEEADTLFDEIRDIHQPFIDRAMEDHEQTNDPEAEQQWLKGMVGQLGGAPHQSAAQRATRLAFFLLIAQIILGIWNTADIFTQILPNTALPVISTGPLPAVLLALASVLAVALLGFAYGRKTAGF